MARNLFSSSCCGNVVRLSDLRGKSIEFRRYAKEPPVIGTKWVCPNCSNTYFAWWRDAEWRHDAGWIRGFVIDLSYYETFNDELAQEPLDEPSHLCYDDALDAQEIW